MNVVFREILVSQVNGGTHYIAQIKHCIMQKDDFPLYNTNQKINLVAKNKEPEQKHAKLIYFILLINPMLLSSIQPRLSLQYL